MKSKKKKRGGRGCSALVAEFFDKKIASLVLGNICVSGGVEVGSGGEVVIKL